MVDLRRALILASIGLISLNLAAQTDETIFREFQFDFATPGARANAMGRAFVGLADEGTISYNNPAGLGVLQRPEFSMEFRNSTVQFDVLQENDSFRLVSGSPSAFVLDSNQLGFASFSLPLKKVNLSVFFINHLDYQRFPNPEQTRWQNRVLPYEFSYFADHKVDIRLDTFGLSAGRSFGAWSFGLVAGQSNLKLDYTYKTILFSDFLNLIEPVESEAKADLSGFNWVLGSLYEFSPRWKWGFVYKKQPAFHYQEKVLNPQFPGPEKQPYNITFKVPDSINTGISFQASDFFTVVGDLDFIQYSQLGAGNLTLISGDQFTPEDYRIPDALEIHLGAEYLWPVRNHILAFRGGWFNDPDHKTRFVGQTESELGAIQDFIFNTGSAKDNRGWTAGLGYVYRNKVQVDFAWVKSDRFDWLVTSLLYRF
ncbi:MAG: outer membrane protein transport protein [Acidobacteria bacterium]|nr:outer membrane protein transport protein [Acidobacteriota bacterium]